MLLSAISGQRPRHSATAIHAFDISSTRDLYSLRMTGGEDCSENVLLLSAPKNQALINSNERMTCFYNKRPFNRKFACSALCMTIWIIANSDALSSPPHQEQSQLRHEVAVILKLVQVYVADKKGSFVQGLRKDDFLLFDEGRKMPITEFEEHTLSFPLEKEEKNRRPLPQLICPNQI